MRDPNDMRWAPITGIRVGKPSREKLSEQGRAICASIAYAAYLEAEAESGRIVSIQYESEAQLFYLRAELVRLAMPKTTSGYAPQPETEAHTAFLNVLASTKNKIVLDNKSVIELKWEGGATWDDLETTDD